MQRDVWDGQNRTLHESKQRQAQMHDTWPLPAGWRRHGRVSKLAVCSVTSASHRACNAQYVKGYRLQLHSQTPTPWQQTRSPLLALAVPGSSRPMLKKTGSLAGWVSETLERPCWALSNSPTCAQFAAATPPPICRLWHQLGHTLRRLLVPMHAVCAQRCTASRRTTLLVSAAQAPATAAFMQHS